MNNYYFSFINKSENKNYVFDKTGSVKEVS